MSISVRMCEMENRKCLVCSVPISVTRLGVDVCRACAAFFKRTILAGRSYTCRQTDGGKCTFRKHEQSMYQSCRLDKCLELGMEYNEPPKRKSRKNVEVELPDLTFLPEPKASSSRESMIDRMRTAYKSSHDRRLVEEQQYVAENQLPMIDHPTEDLYFGCLTDFYEVLRITLREARKMVEEAFDEFEKLPSEFKTKMFKNFYGRFRFIEMMYLSKQYFDNDFNYVASLIICIDTNNVDEWVTEKDDVERRDDFRESVKSFTGEYLIIMAPMRKIDKLNEKEFHALLVLAFCDSVQDLAIPDESFEAIENSRSKVLEEMQEYYKDELQMTDYSKRLGNLLMVAHGSGEAGILLNEELRLYGTVFDFYKNDPLIYETFLI